MRINNYAPAAVLSASLLGAILLPAIASAQMPPGGGGRSHEGRAKSIGPPRAEPGIVAMVPLADQVEEQLGKAREALKPTPAQLPNWQNFEVRAMQLVVDLQRWKQRTRLPTDNIAAPLAVEKQIDVTRNHLTALEDLSAAMRPLYASLSDGQKPVADAQLPAIVGLLVNGGDVPADIKGAREPRSRTPN